MTNASERQIWIIVGILAAILIALLVIIFQPKADTPQQDPVTEQPKPDVPKDDPVPEKDSKTD